MKKLLDDKGRLFGIINIIDIAVILIVLLLAAAVYVKYNVLEKTSVSAENTPITYEITIEGIRQSALDTLRSGDTLYSAEGGAIGVISAVSSNPAREKSPLMDGSFVISEIPERYDVTLVIQADGIKKDGRCYVNRTYELNRNSERLLYTKYNSFAAIITGIQ